MQDPLEYGSFDHNGLLVARHGALAGDCYVTYRTGVAPRTGLSARREMEVTEADTAEAMSTGSVPVLATPRLIVLCEEASCKAIDAELPESSTSVAKRVQFDHLAPVSIGATVRAEATLDRIEGRRLVFTLSVSESAGLGGRGQAHPGGRGPEVVPGQRPVGEWPHRRSSGPARKGSAHACPRRRWMSAP